MDVTPLIKHGQQIIQSYAGGIFRVSGKVYSSSIIVMPEDTIEWACTVDDDGAGFLSLPEDSFEGLLARAADIDVVLLGTGKTMKFLNPDLKNTLKNKGVSVDPMDTGAACRTYNVLMAEGRRVAAALLPV